MSLTVQVTQDRHEQLKSTPGVWKEPMVMFRSISTRAGPGVSQGKGSRTIGQHGKGPLIKQSSAEMKRPSRWSRLWRGLSLDSGKASTVRAQGLNYDAHTYAMNFETEGETPREFGCRRMPTITGPGAREIVTVLLRRSSSANRNSGFMWIPKPVFDPKIDKDAPLWKRRSMEAPLSLDTTRTRAPLSRRQSNAV